jgi:hypothetical protein
MYGTVHAVAPVLDLIPVTTLSFWFFCFHFSGLLLITDTCNLDLFTLPAVCYIQGSIGGVFFFPSLFFVFLFLLGWIHSALLG